MSNNLNAVDSIPENAVRGLPGDPYCLDSAFEWESVESGALLRDADGNLILCRESFRSGEAMSKYLGQRVDVVRFFTKGRPGTADAEQYPRFGFIAECRPSLMQRAAIVALAWLYDTHVAPIPAKEFYTIPADLDPDCAKRRVAGLRGFTSEQKALMAVEGISDQLGIEGRIFEDGGGWYVNIPDCVEIDDMERVIRLSAILEMVFSFDIVRTGYSAIGDELSGDARIAERKRLDGRASYLHCIESKLDALLTRLDAHVDPHRDTTAAKDAPAVVDAFAEDDNSDKHQRREPSRKSGKSSAKKEG